MKFYFNYSKYPYLTSTPIKDYLTDIYDDSYINAHIISFCKEVNLYAAYNYNLVKADRISSDSQIYCSLIFSNSFSVMYVKYYKDNTITLKIKLFKTITTDIYIFSTSILPIDLFDVIGNVLLP